MWIPWKRQAGHVQKLLLHHITQDEIGAYNHVEPDILRENRITSETSVHKYE